MMGKIKHSCMLLFVAGFLLMPTTIYAQQELLQKIKAKQEKIIDYVADGTMKIDVSFINAPSSKVKIYYKKPDQFKVVKDGGISILPKGGMSVNLNLLLMEGNSTVVDAGETTIDNIPVRILKILPLSEESDILLSTLYIDEQDELIRRSKVTSRDNGTYEMNLFYGKYKSRGLPDKVIFSFDTKDYKLPKGITFEYESGEKQKQSDLVKNKKGKIEISYSSYKINTGLSDAIFK